MVKLSGCFNWVRGEKCGKEKISPSQWNEVDHMAGQYAEFCIEVNMYMPLELNQMERDISDADTTGHYWKVQKQQSVI